MNKDLERQWLTLLKPVSIRYFAKSELCSQVGLFLQPPSAKFTLVGCTCCWIRRADAARSQMALGLCGGSGQPPRLNARKRFLGVSADDPVWNLWVHTSYLPGGFLAWRVPKP